MIKNNNSLENINAVFYCDGSCSPNRGYAGYGIFGYTYVNTNTPSNYKYPIHSLFFTDKGVFKDRLNSSINVIDIIEVIRCLNKPDSTNNEAELSAFITTLEKANTISNLIKLDIYTDSMYIVSCYNDSLSKWKTNGWLRIDNKQIVHLNEWKTIDFHITKLKEKGVEVTINWVKGHSDSYCNYIADLYSIIGSNASKLHKNINNPLTTILDKSSSFNEFTKSFVDKDFICYFKNLYFSSDKQDDVYYCFLSSSEDAKNIGKKDISSIYSVNVGYVPEFINKLKELYRDIKRNYVIPCCIKLNKLDNKDILRLINLIPLEYMLSFSNGSYYLVGDTTPFIHECKYNYPFIMSAISLFNNILDLNNNPTDYKCIDVTDRFIKNKKLIISNKDKDFDFTNILGKIDANQKLIVSIGYDLPSYLALKSIEKEIESICMIIEQDGNYLTLYFKIKTNDRCIYTCNIKKKYVLKLNKK